MRSFIAGTRRTFAWVGQSVRRPADEISRRWCDDDHVGLAGESNVIQGVSGSEDLCVNGSSGDRLEGDWSDELAGAASHHHIHLSTGLCKQTRQPH
jgi:hypothetical protein